MKRRLGALLAVLMVAVLVLSACAKPATPTAAPQPTQAKGEGEPTAAPKPVASFGKVVVATDAAFPPMEFVDENKNIVGFDIDMMNAISAKMGFEVEYKNTAWDGIFAGLESGDYDAILSAVTINDERKVTYDFSDPYVNAGQAVVVRVGETEIKSDADLPGKVVGAQIGTTGAIAVGEIAGVTLKEYDSIDLAMLDLVNGNVQAVVVDTPVAADFALTSEQFKGKLQIVGEPFTEEYYGVVVRKGEMGDFLAAFNEGLKAIKADGTYDKIYAKWISGETAMAPGGTTPSAQASAGIPPAPGFPLKVGVVVPLSGDVKTFGESVRDGAAMAFEEAKALGWEIETVLADTKCDPQEASNAANKVIFEDGVKYIVGAVCSSATIPVSEIAEANQVLMISPTATNPVVTLNEDGSTKEYSFRACFLDPFQGEVVAALAQDLGASKAAVLYDVGNDYVKGLAEYFKASFEGMGGTVPVFEAYTKDDTDFSGILGKVAAADVDVMFLPDYYNKVNLIAQQAKEKGIEVTLLGGDGWDSPELRVDMVEGGYFSNHYSPADPRPMVQDFVAAFTEKFGRQPDSFATLAYDAAKILLQSIAEAGADDPVVVKDKMAAIAFEGVSGQITFDAQHNPVKKAAVVKIESGEKKFYKFVAPPGAESGPAEPAAEASVGVPPAPGFPIKVAQIVPLSGDVKTFGESSRDGAAMKFEEARALGWDIEVVLADGKCDAQEAANAANKVIFEDGVKYILGEVCSSATIPITEIAEPSQVVVIAPTATNPVVTLNEDGSTKEYSFRACFLDPFQGEVVAALAQELGASKAAVLYDVGNDYVKGLAEYFKLAFEAKGGTVPVFEAYTKDDTDFSAILGKVAAADVDVMFLPDYYNKVNLIAQQAKEKGIDATLLGGDGWDSPELRVDMVEGGYFSNHYSPADPRPMVQDFVTAYTEKYGAEPDALATLAYDAAGILLQAIAEAGVDDPAVVKDKLEGLQYEGISGEITFDAQHNPVKKAAVVKIENGQKVFFKFVQP